MNDDDETSMHKPTPSTPAAAPLPAAQRPPMASPTCVPDGERPSDTTMLDWLDEHGDHEIHDYYYPPDGRRRVELVDEFGDTVGEGGDLRAAIHNAMRNVAERGGL